MATPLAQPRAAAPRPAGRRPLRRAALVLAAVLAVLVPAVPSSAEEPQTAAEAASLVAAKAHELEVVTERFNEAREKLRAEQAAAQQSAEELEKAQAALARSQKAVRGIARSAFTGEGLSTFSAMMTSGRGSRITFSSIGIRVRTSLIFSAQNRMYGSSSTASMEPGSVTR
jgi:membrane-bound lytic murein transglycosylase B